MKKCKKKKKGLGRERPKEDVKPIKKGKITVYKGSFAGETRSMTNITVGKES